MTNPPTKERLQAISDERLAQLITIERGRSALYVETAIQGQTLTLVEDRLSALLELQSLRALQSLDREGVGVNNDLRTMLAAHLCDEYDCDFYPVPGAQWPEDENDDGKREGGYVAIQPKHVQARALEQADRILSALTPQPETSKEVVETEAVLDGPELWEIVFGVFKGDVPEELTDEKLSQIAAAVQRVFIHPAPQSPPAPVVDEGMKLLEENCWDMRCLSSPIADTGDADIVWHVIEHHMAKPMERVVGVGSTPQEALIAALEGRS